MVRPTTRPWSTTRLPLTADVRAPDGSEIRTLVSVAAGSLVHCRLLPGQVTQAVRHRTVEEVWYCLSGVGQVWRRDLASSRAETVDIAPGVALTIPLGTAFQFRAGGSEPLDLLLTTMPPWPGHDEAVAESGAWESTL